MKIGKTKLSKKTACELLLSSILSTLGIFTSACQQQDLPNCMGTMHMNEGDKQVPRGGHEEDEKEEVERDALAIPRLFQGLEGEWNLQRNLGKQGSMQGTACFRSLDNAPRYHYKEEGLVTLDTGKQLPAQREYIYAYDGRTISVYFRDPVSKQKGGLLHTLQFSTPPSQGWPLHAKGIHRCNPDVYYADYTFRSYKEFHMRYRVLGPRKNYTITTLFSKKLRPII